MKEKIFLSEIEDNDKVNCINEGGNESNDEDNDKTFENAQESEKG
jgi:hypothetical protein